MEYNVHLIKYMATESAVYRKHLGFEQREVRIAANDMEFDAYLISPLKA
jgi:hypothetical protein